MEKNIATGTEWKELASSLTWREVFTRYFAAIQRLEAHCTAHPELRETVNPVAFSIGGLATVYAGLRNIINDASRYDDLASREMAETVLAMASRIEREMPAVTTGPGTA